MELTPKLRQAVKDYKVGKADSFTCLYEESSKYIYTCIYKVLSGNDNSEDLICDMMQDTYVEISKNIAQLEDEERFLSWAGTIATRKCYAYLKKNKKYVLLNEEDIIFDTLADSDEIIPEEVMQSKEKQRLVREIIDTQLTEMQKICIISYYYNEQKQSEIAEELGIPENTVKTNLSRAKAKIKEGVLDLEKNKNTKLYSVAPLFLLLFTEDVQAASVPEEVSSGVLSDIVDVTNEESAIRATVSEETAGGATGATSAGTTMTVSSKAGMIGKVSAASVKTKIIVTVAAIVTTVTVGGAVLVASLEGVNSEGVESEASQGMIEKFPGDENVAVLTTEIPKQSTETAINEEITTENELPVTEMEEVEIETEIAENDNSDAEYVEVSTYIGMYDETLHFRVAYLPNEVMNGEERGGDEAFVRRSLIRYSDESIEKFYFRVFPKGPIADSGLDLKNMSDEQIGAKTKGTVDYATLERVETEKMYMVFVEYEIEMDLAPFGGYDLFINDYETGRAYVVKLNRTLAFNDSALNYRILKSFEILKDEV